jgi:hypothetical protein
MQHILHLQSMQVSFLDEGSPLSDMSCPVKGSNASPGCSTSSNFCDVAGMGEHFF